MLSALTAVNLVPEGFQHDSTHIAFDFARHPLSTRSPLATRLQLVFCSASEDNSVHPLKFSDML